MLLEVQGVSSGYGKTIIIKEIDMIVDKNEIAVIIGPNGSGKSTLMKTIFGLISPVQGDVYFEGRRISSTKPDRNVKQGLSYVPQLDSTFPSLTVSENLQMGAYTLDDHKERLEEVLDMFPLISNKRDTKVINLSGGERQTVAVARAMMTKPKLLLLDEPTAALSPVLVSDILGRIQEIRKAGTSILLVEQNAKSSLAIADRGYVLVMGRKAFEGTGQEILDHKDIGRLYLGKGNST